MRFLLCQKLGESPVDSDINNDTITVLSADEILTRMKRNPAGISFKELCKVCDQYFGKPRYSSSSHRVYKTPWRGDPRVNIQNAKGKAKPYQVRQVVRAVRRLEQENGNEY